jgi:cell division protein FtsB
MNPGDPWSNPSYRRREPVRNALRGGRNRIGTLLILGLLCFGLLGLATGEYGFKRMRELREQERALTAEIASAKERVAKLEFDASDPDRVREREAREGWDMLKPNELLYEIVRPDSAMRSQGIGQGAEGGGPGDR